MGQYYMPTLIDDNGVMKTVCSHEYNNGLKLMEHSYIGNNFMAAVMNVLEGTPHRLWWLGDYAEISDFKNKEYRLLSKDRQKAWKDKYRICPLDSWDWNTECYIINLDTNSYVVIKDNGEDWQVNPLSLLTAVGNGRGSGDYYDSHPNYDKVGIWAGNRIMVSRTKPNDMEDVTKECLFSENSQRRDNYGTKLCFY